MNPFLSLRDYEAYLYALPEQFPTIRASTLVLIRRSAAVAIVKGELIFSKAIHLGVVEYVTFHKSPGNILGYSYELWRGTEKLYWYDSQAHPNDPSLASTHPHHKHVPPDIKHNRIPAPGLSFTQPNLPFLIREIEQTFFTDG